MLQSMLSVLIFTTSPQSGLPLLSRTSPLVYAIAVLVGLAIGVAMLIVLSEYRWGDEHRLSSLLLDIPSLGGLENKALPLVISVWALFVGATLSAVLWKFNHSLLRSVGVGFGLSVGLVACTS